MIPAPMPANEQQRLAALRAYDILDTPPEEAFDRITELLALLLDTPVALVSFVDADRQWFKSRVGTADTETPRQLAFCGYTILSDDAFIVEDTHLDRRFLDHPLVTEVPGLRFYAGAPLTSHDGLRIGSLCTIDSRPRHLSDRERRILQTLARIASDQLELRRTGQRLDRELHERAAIERRKDELVASVSHELRTPLTSIAGSLALIASGAAGALPDQAKRLVEIAHRNSQRLQLIVNDILDAERIASGKVTFRREPFLIDHVAGQAVEAVQPFARKFGVGLHLATTAGQQLAVAGDAERTLQVMDNLLSNAIKFSPANSTVEIAVEGVGPSAVVSVRDHGPGIAQEFHDRVFERFTMAEGPARPVASSGLGLNIARAIVEGQGGEIGFFSPLPDGGTRFWFSLPRATATP